MVLFLLRAAPMSSVIPHNLRKQDNSPAVVAQAADYAVSVADSFTWWWRSNGPAHVKDAARPFAGLNVLEVGPGPTLGSSVLLACGGAQVAVADRFSPSWDADFHAPFYRAILDRVSERGEAYTAPIGRLLAAGDFVDDVVRRHAVAAEELSQIGEAFDVVLSNAVLEHVQHLQTSVANLAMVTAAGGYGFHQVDLRDHRDFNRPLEYLTLSEQEYDAIRERTLCDSGCQWRVSSFVAAFSEAGFHTSVSVNLTAEPEYMEALRPRLHPDFAGYSDQDLMATSAFFVLHRPR